MTREGPCGWFCCQRVSGNTRNRSISGHDVSSPVQGLIQVWFSVLSAASLSNTKPGLDRRLDRTVCTGVQSHVDG